MFDIEPKQLASQRSSIREWITLFTAFFALLFAYHQIFGQFFPTRNGTLGHDWSWTIPNFLIGAAAYYQPDTSFFSLKFGAEANPSVCHAAAGYGFSFPHTPGSLLMWLGVSPVSIAYIHFLLFSAAGFWGMFLWLRRCMDLLLPIALLGAALFMFNGFYAHRIVIGHLYYSVMLVPLLAFCLTSSARRGQNTVGRTLLWGVLAGVVAYYAYVYSVIVVMVAFMLALLALLAIWLFQRGALLPLLLRSSIALAVAAGLAFQSIYSTVTSQGMEVAVAQRVAYSLPVFRDVLTTLRVLFEMLFLAPVDIEQIYLLGISNLGIAQQRHELEYGITLVPLLLLLAYAAWGMWNWLRTDAWVPMNLNWRHLGLAAVILLILMFPIAYTTHFPELLPLIKKTPLINATTSPQRTFFLYVLVIPVFAVLAMARFVPAKWAWPVVVASMIGMVGSVAWKDREFYHAQPYDPKPVQEAHTKMKHGWRLPPIERLGVLSQGTDAWVHDQMVEANLFLQGVQHMGCYIPGYSSVPMEYMGSLHPGSIWDVKDGYFNIKNPACNSWPKENGCRPGDHFKVEQRVWVERYVSYRSFPIQVPDKARWAAEVSAYSFFGVLVFLIGSALVSILKQVRMRNGNGA